MTVETEQSVARRPQVTRIRPARRWRWPNLWESIQYRELLYFLMWRDVKVRYKQTLLGATWAVLQPLATMVVFTIFFGRLAGLPSQGIPYHLFSLAALVPWTFFANALTQASNSLIRDVNLVTKIYFPRLLVPTSAALAGLIDFAVAFLVLIAMMLQAGFVPGLAMVLLPVFLLLAIAAVLGAGLWLAALNAQFRDVKYVVPFLVQVWLFLTPIAYPSSLLTGSWRVVYGLNPMVAVVEGFRWALFGTPMSGWQSLVASVATGVGLLVSGLLYFRRAESKFADVI